MRNLMANPIYRIFMGNNIQSMSINTDIVLNNVYVSYLINIIRSLKKTYVNVANDCRILTTYKSRQ